MHIELKARMAGPNGNFAAGSVLAVGEGLDITKRAAAVLLLADVARSVEDPAVVLARVNAEKLAAAEGESETATAEPEGETTAQARPSRRKKKTTGAAPRRKRAGGK